MRAIGLVLLSIAIMALLLTDADAQRRSSAQGSPAAGASRSWCSTFPAHKASTTTAAIRRLMNAGRRSWAAAAAFADPIRFPGRRMGPATPGQVRSARAAAGSSPVRHALTACKQDEIALRNRKSNRDIVRGRKDILGRR